MVCTIKISGAGSTEVAGAATVEVAFEVTGAATVEVVLEVAGAATVEVAFEVVVEVAVEVAVDLPRHVMLPNFQPPDGSG
ncbi:hypothetical protein ACVBEF_13605 [Glaciimonas sp. GG7]